METNNTTPTTDKNVSFEIIQEGFSYAFTLSGDAKQFNKTSEEITKAVTRQICGRLYGLMLIRKQSGQKLGLNLSKNFSFGFTVSGQFVNTTTVQEKLKLTLKIGNKSERRKKFELTLGLIINEILRGNKLYSQAEVNKLAEELQAVETAEKLAKNAKPKTATKRVAKAEPKGAIIL